MSRLQRMIHKQEVKVAPEEIMGMIAAARPVLIEGARAMGSTVPIIPQVARQVIKLTGAPQTTMREIEELIKQDPLLAAQLLRVANAPRYMAGKSCNSLSMALMRVGFVGIRELLLVASTSRLLIVRSDPSLTAKLQQQSLAVAVVAGAIAALLHQDSDEAFMAGLLHQIGVPIGLDLLDAHRRQLPAALVASNEAQVQVAEALHEPVGAALAEAWGLPPQVRQAIGQHHRPPTGKDARLAQTVGLADRIVDFLNNAEEHGMVFSFDGFLGEALGLTSDQIQWLLREMPTQIRACRAAAGDAH